MKQPNPVLHNPEPAAVRRLVDSVMENRNWSQNEVARRIGVTDRAMRFWCSGQRTIPYTAQFALESLIE